MNQIVFLLNYLMKYKFIMITNLSECTEEICYVSLHILGGLVDNVGGGDDQLGGVVEVPVPGPPVLGHAQHGGSEIL